MLAASLLSLCAAPGLSSPQASPPAAVMAQPDQVILKSVSPEPGGPLAMGRPVPFQVTVQYTLSSEKVAVLALYVEVFQKTDSACAGDVHGTDGGTYVNLEHGTGTRTILVTWPGTAPKQIAAPGSLSFGANLWTSNRAKEIKAFGMLNARQYCYPLP